MVRLSVYAPPKQVPNRTCLFVSRPLVTDPPWQLPRHLQIPRARSQDPLSRFFRYTHKISITRERSQYYVLLYYHSKKKSLISRWFIHSRPHKRPCCCLAARRFFPTTECIFQSRGGSIWCNNLERFGIVSSASRSDIYHTSFPTIYLTHPR